MVVWLLVGCSAEEAAEPQAPSVEVTAPARIKPFEPPRVQSGDAGNISKVVKEGSGGITTCLDRALIMHRETNGRVSVGWTITEGKVTEAHLVSNTTGDDELAQCMVRAVRRFHFDPGLTAEVPEFPWVVSGQ